MQNDQKPQHSGVAGGVVAIVVTGVVLGLAFNALGRSGHPQRGLAWLRHAEQMEKLEDVAEANAPDTAAMASPDSEPAPGANDGPAAIAPAPQQQKPAPSAAASNPKVARAEPTARPPTWNPPGTASPAKTASATSAPSAAPPGNGDDGGGSHAPTTVASPVAAPNLPAIPVTDHPISIELPTFKKFFDARAAAIVDARDKEEYVAGHVAGAESIPFDDTFSDPTLLQKFKPGDRPIICYCSGPGCDLSMQLATSMIDAGFKRVLVFEGGYPAWEGAGYPVVKGSEPGGH
jgi:rhodanese-related sulfurtransferase